MLPKIRLAVVFHRLGPYHIARLLALAETYEVVAIELSKTTSEYLWDEVATPEAITRVTLFEAQDSREVSPAYLQKRLFEALDCYQLTAVLINGWYEKGALLANLWCLQRGIPAFVMSATTAIDFQRQWWKELVKKRIVATFSGAIVGGKPHADYIKRLGMTRKPIAAGYDVVDNAHFEQGAAEAKAQSQFYRKQYGLPAHYFLASSRFIKKKNLFRLLQAYAEYRKQALHPFDLVLLGDGELSQQIIEAVHILGLQQAVHLPGFKQYDELPIYYGLAEAFVHASTSEQWGLVINEAMASGLPVIVSKNCGCTEDLVRHGRNGYVFDPYDVSELTDCMLALHEGNQDHTMGLHSIEIIQAYSPDTFRQAVGKLVSSAKGTPDIRLKDKLIGQLVIRLLVRQ